GIQPLGGLYIVQFVGPIKDDWLEALKATGVEVVTYIPSNAYVVCGNSVSAARLLSFATQNRFAQYVGDYEPAFRLTSGLRAVREKEGSALVDVTVQVIDGPEAKRTIANLAALASEVLGSDQVMNYHNVALRVKAADLAQIASYGDVFAIEERTRRA